MKRLIANILVLAAITAPSLSVWGADAKRGEALHKEYCTICHQPSLYTRKDRKIHSREQLWTQVNLCQEDAGADWSPGQIEDVVTYLNTNFYKFKQ